MNLMKLGICVSFALESIGRGVQNGAAKFVDDWLESLLDDFDGDLRLEQGSKWFKPQ